MFSKFRQYCTVRGSKEFDSATPYTSILSYIHTTLKYVNFDKKKIHHTVGYHEAGLVNCKKFRLPADIDY